MIRVIIVEDEPAIARGLSLLITKNYPDFEVQALCRNGKDGLKKILELKPDLVFADINMPVMTGLDMIRQVQSSGFHTRCVILTGYADFEYARTAISLGISDYLLKPILPDTLNTILTSCRQQRLSATRQFQEKYLQNCLTTQTPVIESENPLRGYSCTLLFLFSGPMYSNTYTENFLFAEPQLHRDDALKKLENDYSISILRLRGYHHNEQVFALISPPGRSANIRQIAEDLYHLYSSSDTYLNLVISDTRENGENIRELAATTYHFAVFHNLFGIGRIKKYQIVKNELIHVSKEVKQICAGIPAHPGMELLRNFILSIISHWEQTHVTQFQLITDLRYFIGSVIHNCSEAQITYPDAAEIVAACHSYADLEKELIYETSRICGANPENILPGTQQSLAQQVKNWLDKNFTSQITYKIFQDIFGHNEKYLSALFKDEFGISPSKYVGELRMNMAKKLMQSNPDILLKDVAEMVGFTDAFYFSRVFKSHEGISPSAYMKQQKEQQP